MSSKVIAITSCDAKYFPLLMDMMRSTKEQLGDTIQEFGCFDLGLDDDNRNWLTRYTDRVVRPKSHFGVSVAPDQFAKLGFLVRPFLPEYFPGFDTYLWIDSDIWLQSPDAILAMLRGADEKGMAIAHESERAYRFQRWLFMWTAKHFLLGYGFVRGSWLLTRPHVNAGLFAVARDAPHWLRWADRYRAAIARTGLLTPHDQFSLNQAVHDGTTDTALLPANANWICDRGVPMWNDETCRFCEPYPPYKTISTLHLAGPAKKTAYRIRRTGGGSFEAMIRYGARPPEG